MLLLNFNRVGRIINLAAHARKAEATRILVKKEDVASPELRVLNEILEIAQNIYKSEWSGNDSSTWECRICGCTDTNACRSVGPNGENCFWIDANLCSNPKCLQAANIKAEAVWNLAKKIEEKGGH